VNPIIDNGDEPTSVKHFKHLIKERALTSPDKLLKSNQESKCKTCSYTKVGREPVTNSYGNTAIIRALAPNRHHALQVSDEVASFLSRPIIHSTRTEISAIATFTCLMQDTSPTSLLRRLGDQDARSVYPLEMLRHLYLLNEIFLPCELHLDFSFSPESDHDLGSCTTENGISNIRLSATKVAEWGGGGGVGVG
jgi:hypothetical protein